MAGWEVVTPAQMGVVTFRCVPEDIPPEALDRLNRTLVDAVLRDGFSMIVSTELHDRPVLRMCTINPRTTEKDIRSTLERLDQVRQHLTSSRVHLSGR
jgi:glutamate/tyrosine decarboxylase-like PLP-dependent enzyme